MKLAVFIAAVVLTTSPALAFDQSFRNDFKYDPPEGWRTQVLDNIKNVSRKVTDTMWGQPISLWVEVKSDGTNWDKAGRSFCRTLSGSGKPDDELITISIWQDDEIVAKIPCD